MYEGRVRCGCRSPLRRACSPPPHIRKAFDLKWYKVTRRAPKGQGTWVYDPPSPRPSPPLRRGRGYREWGDVIPFPIINFLFGRRPAPYGGWPPPLMFLFPFRNPLLKFGIIPTNGKRDISSAPAPQSGCTGDWYRLKRKSVPGNSITQSWHTDLLSEGCTLRKGSRPMRWELNFSAGAF
jgi:hypothetical protein